MGSRKQAAAVAAVVFCVVAVAWFALGALVFGPVVYDDRPAPVGEDRPERRWYQAVARSELEARGQLGDMFGVAGSFFASLSLVGIAFTLYLQQQQLRHQQQEIELQREQLRHQQQGIELQQADVRNQRAAAEDEKLLAIATSYWEEPAAAHRRHAERLVQIVGPALSDRFPAPTAYPRDAADQVLRALVVAYLDRSETTRAVFVSRLDEFTDRYEREVENRPGEPARALAARRGDRVAEFVRWLDGLTYIMGLHTRYARVWISKANLQREPAGGPAALPLRAGGYLDNEFLWWGPPLALFIGYMKAYTTKPASAPFVMHDDLMTYLGVIGCDRIDAFPGSLPPGRHP